VALPPGNCPGFDVAILPSSCAEVLFEVPHGEIARLDTGRTLVRRRCSSSRSSVAFPCL
jgi:hypothetical protein